MSSEVSAPARFFLGAMFLAMGLLVGYLSAEPTLRCARGPSGAASCEVRAVALGMVDVFEVRVDGVRSVEWTERTERTRNVRMLFVTGEVKRDLGHFSQQFDTYKDAIDAFARQPGASPLELEPPTYGRPSSGPLFFVILALIGISVMISALVGALRRG